MSIVIETERLVLRQLSEDDAAPLSAICNQAYILKWMPDWEGTVEQRKGWTKWVESQYETMDKDTARVLLAVSLKENNALIGLVGIGNKEEVDNEIEMAFFVSEDHCNKGYITEAAKAMAQWVFNTLRLEYLMAIVEIDNIPSQRVVEKCGFVKHATKSLVNSGGTVAKPFYYYRLYNNSNCLR